LSWLQQHSSSRGFPICPRPLLQPWPGGYTSIRRSIVNAGLLRAALQVEALRKAVPHDRAASRRQSLSHCLQTCSPRNTSPSWAGSRPLGASSAATELTKPPAAADPKQDALATPAGWPPRSDAVNWSAPAAGPGSTVVPWLMWVGMERADPTLERACMPVTSPLVARDAASVGQSPCKPGPAWVMVLDCAGRGSPEAQSRQRRRREPTML